MIGMKRKLPIGIQSFEQIITDQYLLVDKTEYIYQLVHNGKPYFLSRPRRFGKSLLLSTMKAYWEGKKELFRGLKIEELEEDNPKAWEAYPVFYLDFNQTSFQKKEELESVLETQINEWEKKYGDTPVKAPLGTRFGLLLKAAAEQTGKRSVVLVDEYDKPLLETMGNGELIEHNKAVFKGFFSALKSADEYTQFIFITGVTKFSKVSIFSDMNQLQDISMMEDYATICGITEKELRGNFSPEIEMLAGKLRMTPEACLAQLKQTYDGYHFCEDSEGVYNPFSLLNAFSYRKMGYYWFETGTPTFLVIKLKTIQFDVRKFTDRTLYATEQMLKDYRDDNPDPVPLLYQTGYLTISDYDYRRQIYTLAFPNEEVKYGLLASLMPEYVQDYGAKNGKDILTLTEYVENGNLEMIREVFTALFASIPYTAKADPFEHDFQTVIYITLTLLGQYVRCEQYSSAGRVDCVVETERFVYLFEFKRDGSAEEALNQIREKRYAEPYAADPRQVYLIGVNFDSGSRQLDGWKAIEG